MNLDLDFLSCISINLKVIQILKRVTSTQAYLGENEAKCKGNKSHSHHK